MSVDLGTIVITKLDEKKSKKASSKKVGISKRSRRKPLPTIDLTRRAVAPKEGSGNIISALRNATFATEGLLPGQTPLRITSSDMRNWKTIQGVPIVKYTNIPADRTNFFWVAEEDVPTVIDRQWKHYFTEPQKFGLSDSSTLEDVIRVFDKTRPENKIRYLRQHGIDLNATVGEIRRQLTRNNSVPSNEYIKEYRPNAWEKLRDIARETSRFLGVTEYPAISGKSSPLVTAILAAGRAATGEAAPATEEDIKAEQQHPIAATAGKITGGIAPYIAAAPFFPPSLAGLIGEFGTIGAAQGILRQAGENKSALQKLLGAGKEAAASASFAIPFHYANYIKIAGKPVASALARAGTKGAAVTALSKLYGSDLKRAFEQGGVITALSLIAESPSLAKTALGRGIIKEANRIAKESGLPEGRYTIDADMLDRASEKTKLSKLIRIFTKLRRTKGKPGPGQRPEFDRLPGPEETPPPDQPKAGGVLHTKAQEYLRKKNLTIVGREPPIRMTKSMTVKDVHGKKVTLPAGEEYTPYKLSNNQTLLVDGKEVIVNKSQLENVEKQNIKLGQGGIYFPEDVEVIVKGEAPDLYEEYQAKLRAKYGIPEGQPINPDILTPEEDLQLDKLATSPTKYDDYQLPGGKNYREVLLQQPETPLVKERLDRVYGKIPAEQYRKEFERYNYKSPHWSEPNILAHIRLNDRYTPDGKKVLFVEEIQSDWAREGREKGFKRDLSKETDAAVREEIADKIIQQVKRLGWNSYLSKSELARLRRDLNYYISGHYDYNTIKRIFSAQPYNIDFSEIEGKIPSHPYLKKWQELALRHVLQEAARGGYDAIAWTTGEQQANRYDLSKHIDRIDYSKLKSKDAYKVRIIKDRAVIDERTLTSEQLPSFVGKDVAQKIKKGEGETPFSDKNYKVLKGLDLKIGGEWAKNLYDKQIPNILKKITAKYGGKLAQVQISAGEGISGQPALIITPQLREILLTGGQPKAGSLTPEQRKPRNKPKTPPESTKFEIPASDTYESENIAQGADFAQENGTTKEDEELYRQMMEELEGDLNEQKDRLKSYLRGKLKPELKNVGEYSNIRHLGWLFAKKGEPATTPDDLAGELTAMGFPVENEEGVIKLIEGYFSDEIDEKSKKFVSKYDAKIQKAKERELMKTKSPKKRKRIMDELRMAQLRRIAGQLQKIAEVAPYLITPKQRAYIHILKNRRLISDSQYRRLLKIFTGKKTTKVLTPTGKVKKHFMTKEEAAKTIEGVKGAIKRKGRIILPKRGVKVSPEDIATQEKNEEVEKLIEEANLPFKDVETLYSLLGFKPEYLTRQQQDKAIEKLRDIIKSRRPGSEMRLLMGEDPKFKNKQLEQEYSRLLKAEDAIRNSGFNNGRKRIAAGETASSPLRQQLYLTIKQRLQDVRYTMMELQIKTGIPFYFKYYLPISTAIDRKGEEYDKVGAMLHEGIEKIPDLHQQEKISQYFQALYEGKTPPELTDDEQKYADNVRKVMEYFKDFIREYRFRQWIESKEAGENSGFGYTDIPDVDQDTLEEGYKVWKEQGDKALKDWLKKQTFGTIEKGYIPRAVMGGKIKIPQRRLGQFTRRMLKPRTSKGDYSNIPLHRRVMSYINSVLNLKYLHEPVGELDKVLVALDTGGHLPKTTADAFKSWIRIASGYPRDNSALNKILLLPTRQFFRTITVNPKLWFRNIFQRKITPPFKRPLFLPKYQAPRLKDLPPAVKKYFDLHVNQFEAMKYEYLYFLDSSKAKIPALRKYTQIAEKVGSVYPLTDMKNRESVFVPTYNYVLRFVKLWENGKISLKTLLAHTPYKLMKIPEQQVFLQLLEHKPEGAALFAAKWNSDNSQWLYKLAERSFEEIGTQNSVLYNLFVWPRGLVQLIGHLLSKATAKGVPFSERRAAIASLIGLIIAFELGNRLLNKIWGRKKDTGYSGYNIVRSMFWSIGGAMISELNDFIEALSNYLYAFFYGSPTEKKRAKAKILKEMDSISRLFVPFLTLALGMAEAITDIKYISPLYNIFYKRPKHIERSTIEKIQHFLFRMTNKEETKKKAIRLGNIDFSGVKF